MSPTALPATNIDVTLVIELSTADITGTCDEAANLRAWSRQLADLAPSARR